MSKGRKILLVALFLTVAAAAIAGVLYYDSTHGECGDNLTWKYDGKGTLTISGSGEMWDYDARNNVWPEWSKLRSKITTVIIGEGVTSIGDEAFLSSRGALFAQQMEKYDSLEKVLIGVNVRNIGREAFCGCNSLERIKIPQNVEYIGNSAFRLCTELGEVMLPNQITKISAKTFSNCTSLKQIDIPEGVAGIEFAAFKDCTGLNSITLPGTLESINNSVFQNCTALTEIVIPAGVKSIDSAAFRDCVKLSKITFLGDMPFDLQKTGDNHVLDVFTGVRANAYWPASNDTWIGIPVGYLDGDIEWIEFYP